MEQHIVFKVLLLTYKSLHGNGTTYIKELLISYAPSRSLGSGNQHLLIVPKTNLSETTNRAFGIRAPTEWNKPPLVLKFKDSVDS